jgi:hypothetical protein
MASPNHGAMPLSKLIAQMIKIEESQQFKDPIAGNEEFQRFYELTANLFPNWIPFSIRAFANGSGSIS